MRILTLIGHTLDSFTFDRLVQRCSVHRSLSGVAPLLEAANAGGYRRCQHFLALSSTPPIRLRGARVHLHDALRHRCRRRLLAGHQPRAQVARQRQQLPRLQYGDLRRHGLQRQCVEPPARRLLQQSTEPVERVERAPVRGGFRNKGGPDGFGRECIRFQAVGLAINAPRLPQPGAGRWPTSRID